MPARQPRILLAALLTSAALVAGCGGDDGGDGDGTSAAQTTPQRQTSTRPVASAPAAPPPPEGATEPLPPETQPSTGTTPPATAPETAPQGAGEQGGAEEEAVRVPATFSARGGALTPPQITVPAFLAVELSVASADGRAHTVVVATPTPKRFEVPAGGTGVVRLRGLKAGEYAVELDGRPAGTLVSGGEAGP